MADDAACGGIHRLGVCADTLRFRAAIFRKFRGTATLQVSQSSVDARGVLCCMSIERNTYSTTRDIVRHGIIYRSRRGNGECHKVQKADGE